MRLSPQAIRLAERELRSSRKDPRETQPSELNFTSPVARLQLSFTDTVTTGSFGTKRTYTTRIPLEYWRSSQFLTFMPLMASVNAFFIVWFPFCFGLT